MLGALGVATFGVFEAARRALRPRDQNWPRYRPIACGGGERSSRKSTDAGGRQDRCRPPRRVILLLHIDTLKLTDRNPTASAATAQTRSCSSSVAPMP